MVNHPLHRLFVPLFYPFTYHSLIWLNNSLGWKLVGSATARNPIALPNNFKELLVTSSDANGNTYHSIVPREVLDSTSKMYFLGGYYYNASSVGTWVVNISLKNLSLMNFVASGPDAGTTATTVTTVYYR